MKPNIFCLAVTKLILFFASPVCLADIIALESFDSYSGNIHAGTGGEGWTNNWTAASADTVAQSTEVLSYSNGEVNISGGTHSVLHQASNGNPTLWRSFASQTGPVYFSLLMKLPANATNEFVGFHFTDSEVGLTNLPSFEVGLFPGTAGYVRARIYRPNNTFGTDTETFDPRGNTILVVGRISNEGSDASPDVYDKLDLFINPNTIIEPTPTRTVDFSTALVSPEFAGLKSINTFGFRTANFVAGESVLFDELRIATSYAEAIGIPEPSSFLLGLGGLILLTCIRREWVSCRKPFSDIFQSA